MAQCLDMIAETGVFSVSDGISAMMEPMWCHWGDRCISCSQQG